MNFLNRQMENVLAYRLSLIARVIIRIGEIINERIYNERKANGIDKQELR